MTTTWQASYEHLWKAHDKLKHPHVPKGRRGAGQFMRVRYSERALKRLEARTAEEGVKIEFITDKHGDHLGENQPRIKTLADGVRVVVKNVDSFGEAMGEEYSFRLGNALGFFNVVPAFAAGRSVRSPFLPNAKMLFEVAPEGAFAWDLADSETLASRNSARAQLGMSPEESAAPSSAVVAFRKRLRVNRDAQQIAVLDALVLNGDRNTGNILVKGGRLYSIDAVAESFDEEDWLTVRYPFNQIMSGVSLSDDLRMRLRWLVEHADRLPRSPYGKVWEREMVERAKRMAYEGRIL